MRNWAPLIVVLALLTLLAALFGPGLYRGILLRRSVGSLLDAVRAGRTADIVTQMVPDQQQEVAGLLAQYLPADYPEKITSLRLSSVRGEDDLRAITIVTCKINQGELTGIYQGQLVWHYRDGRWEWDFLASGGAELTLSGEPAWVRLSDLIPEAENL